MEESMMLLLTSLWWVDISIKVNKVTPVSVATPSKLVVNFRSTISPNPPLLPTKAAPIMAVSPIMIAVYLSLADISIKVKLVTPAPALAFLPKYAYLPEINTDAALSLLAAVVASSTPLVKLGEAGLETS